MRLMVRAMGQYVEKNMKKISEGFNGKAYHIILLLMGTQVIVIARIGRILSKINQDFN